MCGIAGIVGPAAEQHAGSVRAMMEMLVRRGPDDEGLHSWANAVLGHRRLSIFDLSAAGRQPMLSQAGRTAVVFNGAIYNFHQLREQLERVGTPFTTQTDTEV